MHRYLGQTYGVKQCSIDLWSIGRGRCNSVAWIYGQVAGWRCNSAAWIYGKFTPPNQAWISETPLHQIIFMTD